ncbi:Mhp1 protein [Candida orthopsilosis Co 90-125]|uniref:Mhp1 protein n=1 Tax=Candida orthopsilosis (strain 90-125) TaxID=1136231 RepID=H8X5K5_CANO9|nr:Mhp1 protein [Candida orthopsilosis Co 90-125]CCG23462.1 Mhp1 protein [Candida orthopsilosis Co 90-125]
MTKGDTNENQKSSLSPVSSKSQPQLTSYSAMVSTDEKEKTNNSQSQQQNNGVPDFLVSKVLGKKLDVETVRDKLEEETNIYTKGVKDTDVDWFLRDASMDPTIPLPKHVSNTTTTENDDDNKNKEKVTPTITEPAATPSTPTRSVNSHLNTDISNSNDAIVTKTKPSISPVQEENIHTRYTPQTSSHNDNHSVKTRRRSSTGGSSGGFFSKLKGKFTKESNEHSPVTTKPSNDHLFKTDYNMTKPNTSKPIHESGSMSSQETSSKTVTPSASGYEPSKLERTKTAPLPSSTTSHPDPRLEEYIRFYKQRDLRRGSTASSASNSSDTSTKHSVLVNGYDSSSYGEKVGGSPYSQNESTSTRLSHFLRRKSSVKAETNYPPSNVPSSATTTAASTSSLSMSPPPLADNLELNPAFKGLKPLKRVAFHSSTFLIDPPQQIPSRTPRKGNVDVLPNGQVRINPLTEEDKEAIEKSQMGLGGGIVVGGTGALGYIPKDAPKDVEKNNEESDGDEAEKESQGASSQDEDEPAIDQHAKNIAIDKFMVHHQPMNYTVPVKKMALDTMYSRCCHLREILPIPAILKQIPEGSMAPLPVLQLRNPHPTMIEVQTFADFVRIAPIVCVSLDGVNLSVEQFKILLSAMSAKKQLEKLSLRNTPINQEGWSLFCWFLSRNTVLNKLDITQCPALSVNVLKKKKKKAQADSKKYEEDLERMTCNKDNRSDVDWSLFVATLVARGGIEELIMTGCCITNVEIFENLIELAVSKKTSRLGLAFNNLTPRHISIIVNSWIFGDFARGLDLGYNDFSSTKTLKIFLDFTKRPDYERILSKATLSFLSLNSTNSVFNDAFKEVFESILMRLPNLKYLDFSNNQRLFGTMSNSQDTNSTNVNTNENATVAYFTSKLPLFPKLTRLHLENENFSQSSILQIANILPFCKNMGYFSILGNYVDSTSASALVNATKNSKTLINLDCNSEEFPELFKERIGLYTMRNMERLLYDSKQEELPSTAESPLKEAITQPESLTEQLNNILALKAQKKLDLSSPDVVKLFSRANAIRKSLKESIEELLNLQLKNALDLDGKETLIRLIYIDSSIEKGLQLIDPNFAHDFGTKANMYLVKVGEGQNRTIDRPELHDDGEKHAEAGIHLEPTQAVPASKSPLVSRSSSKTNLANLDKQEGSMLKLSRLNDYHKIEPGESDMSGDDARKKLMNVNLSDLDKVISYLDDLRSKGISLEKVFKHRVKEGETEKQELSFEALHSQLKKLSKEGIEKQDISSTTKDISDEIKDTEGKDSILSKTYDQVLNNLTN